LQENIGNQYSREGQVPRARAYYARARTLLDAAEGADGVREARRKLDLNSALVSSARDAEPSGAVPYARSADGQGLAALEAAWQAGGYGAAGGDDDEPGSEFERDEAAGVVCRNALLQCATAAAQRPWLCRFLALRRGRTGAGAAARLAGVVAVRGACRACAQPAAAVAARDAKLRLCTACSGVAYCSTACQAADWARHKRHCKAAVAAAAVGGVDAAAALADATCPACHAALVPDDADANLPGVGLVTILRCDHAAHAKCLDAARAAVGARANKCHQPPVFTPLAAGRARTRRNATIDPTSTAARRHVLWRWRVARHDCRLVSQGVLTRTAAKPSCAPLKAAQTPQTTPSQAWRSRPRTPPAAAGACGAATGPGYPTPSCSAAAARNACRSHLLASTALLPPLREVHHSF
jgi:hypothetical protein